MIQFNFSNQWHNESQNYFQESDQSKYYKQFLNTINSNDIGFFHLESLDENIQRSQEIYNHFKDKKCFVQVGIGGSALGPQMALDALAENNDRKFFFFDNVDPDYNHSLFKQINPKESVFYIVSKSGGTVETMANFLTICQFLKDNGIEEKSFSEYFVFATDPVSGFLRELGSQLNIKMLPVPSNIGGRFSIFTPVGFLPMLFANINLEQIKIGINQCREDVLKEKLSDNNLFQSAFYLQYLLKEKGINETVLMPYSSKLRSFSFWFAQLWAESLGKKSDRNNNNIYNGFTPIPAFGATDQHSQVQLFREGPNNKHTFFIEIEKFQNDFDLSTDLKGKLFSKLQNVKMSELLKAELEGTIQAFEVSDRTYSKISLSELNPKNFAYLTFFFECLTALMGEIQNINAFDQPGVEDGKKLAWQWLENKKTIE